MRRKQLGMGREAQNFSRTASDVLVLTGLHLAIAERFPYAGELILALAGLPCPRMLWRQSDPLQTQHCQPLAEVIVQFLRDPPAFAFLGTDQLGFCAGRMQAGSEIQGSENSH